MAVAAKSDYKPKERRCFPFPQGFFFFFFFNTLRVNLNQQHVEG